MSTNLECHIIEPEPSKWYYVLEDGNAPKNAWDWREYATATGPFSTEQEAQDHLAKHESNPGGLSIIPNADFVKTNAGRGGYGGPLANPRRPERTR